MEDQCSPLSWGCFYLEEGIEELKHSLLYTTLELETTILSAHEEIARKEEELFHLKDLLTMTIKERNDFQGKCRMLELEKAVLQQLEEGKSDSAPGELKGGGSNRGLSTSDSTENNPIPPPSFPSPPPAQLQPPQLAGELVPEKPLPENGKFLKAVMEAGPLLQTLLLAGPLPQWQHPPPQLNSLEIPPVTISSPPPPGSLHGGESGISTYGSFNNRKRVMVPCEASYSSSPNTKYQKVVHQSPLTN
ncbi:hypothetical protein C3L33_02746, partial [Rhododendron williamsianum]